MPKDFKLGKYDYLQKTLFWHDRIFFKSTKQLNIPSIKIGGHRCPFPVKVTLYDRRAR